jgi:two-component sensor histidine kinase
MGFFRFFQSVKLLFLLRFIGVCMFFQVLVIDATSQARLTVAGLRSPDAVLNALQGYTYPWEVLGSVPFSGDSLVNWAEQHGTGQQLAMARYVAFSTITVDPSTLYARLVAGNAFWESHRMLRPKAQWDGIGHLMVLYQNAKRFEELLPVTIRYCELRQQLEKNDQCNELGKVYFDLKQYDMSVRYYMQNARNYASVGNDMMTASSFNNVGNCYQQMGLTDSARWAYDRAIHAIRDCQKQQQGFSPAYCAYFKDIVRWNRGSLAEGFDPMNDMPEVVQRVVLAATSVREPQWALKGYKQFMQWHYRNDRELLAAAYCDSAMQIALRLALVYEIPDLLRFKARLALLKGDKATERAYSARAQILDDSLALADAQMQGIVAAAFHEAKEREQDLTASIEREAQTSALADAEKKRRRMFSVLFVIALMVLAVVAWMYRRSVRDKQLIRKQQDALERTLHDKELLLKEIHHRVKNNLQVISSLLDLQSIGMEDGEAKAALEEGKSRVQSIAILHHQLYQHENLAQVELQAFATELAHQVMGVFLRPGQKVELNVAMEETMIDIDTAVPLGLILNELLTNSFKYAFAAVPQGTIDLRLESMSRPGTSPPMLALVYRDNGPGLPQHFELAKATSLGLRLVAKLSKQCKGSTTYRYHDGAEFTVSFKMPKNE